MRPTCTTLATALRAAIFSAAIFSTVGLLLAPAPGQAFSLGELFGSRVDKALLAQVPQDKRAGIDKADFELAVAGEEVNLAKLKEELADKQNDLASLTTKLAKAQAKAAELALDSARIDAVEAENLGLKEDNLKLQAELRVDRTKNEAERIQLKAKMDQTDLFVRDLKERVAAKERSLAGLKARRTASTTASTATPTTTPTAASAAPPAAKPPTPEPLEIINKQPDAPEAPEAKPAPEADLKN
ncbi:MAG: hypothetical protein C0405_05885 [Desulfovibrio sp.]|nr:hypothetical protein [Desulfovibrio sp.]